MHELELWVPNIPDADVPLGTTEEDNVERWAWGTPRRFEFAPKSHADLGEQLGIYADRSRRSHVRDTVPHAARARAHAWSVPSRPSCLIFIPTNMASTEVWIPYLVKSEAMIVSAQLPKFAEDAYYLESDDMYLIPTAEVPLVNLNSR